MQPAAVYPTPGLCVGLLGTFGVGATTMRNRRKALLALVVCGGVLALTGALLHRALAVGEGYAVAGGLGASSLVLLAVWYLQASTELRRELGPVLVAGALMPVFFVAGIGWTDQTARLAPSVLDSFFYAMDTTLPVHSFHVGRL